jgi:hypothetical protein
MSRKIKVTEERVREILSASRLDHRAFHDCFEAAEKDPEARAVLQKVIHEMPNIAKRATGVIHLQLQPTAPVRKLMAEMVDHNPIVQRARVEPTFRMSR